MQLYSSGEIVKKLHGVTTRQILDLAEKGLVKPARETTGAGSARLYDFQNIFEICLCLAIRGRIPAGSVTQEMIYNILQIVRGEQAAIQKEYTDDGRVLRMAINEMKRVGFTFEDKPPCDLILIIFNDKNDYLFREINYKDTFSDGLISLKKFKPQNFCTYILEVAALWNFLKMVF